MLEIFRNYLKNEEYYIILYSNYVYVFNYLDIVSFTDKCISLRLKSILYKVIGNNLLITKMDNKELLIKGNINKLEKYYE